jgi:PTS system nitrogen regulatory IIA component
LRILDYLCDNCIETDLEAESKEEVLRLLAEKAEAVRPELKASDVFGVLKEREDLGSTGIGGGIAIPHGKLQGLERLTIILFRSRKGVPFDSLDKRPVSVICLLLAPDDAAPIYLRILARVSRVLKDQKTFEGLMAATDAAEIKEVIGQAESVIR